MSDTTQEPVAPTGVTADLALLDQVFDDARAKRNVVADKLAAMVADLAIDTAKPREAEVKIQLIKLYIDTLGANEASAAKRAASKLKQVETESAGKHSAAVAELLSKISVGSVRTGETVVPPDVSQVEARIEQAFADHGLEPVLDSELRTDPKDVDG
jgi:hypothetical protein